MAKEKVAKPEEEKTPEVVETEDGGVTVSLEEEAPETEQEEVKKEPEVKPEVKPEDHLKNKVFAQERIISKLQREMELLKSAKPLEKEPEPELDDLDKLAQKDWKAAVRKLSIEEARKIIQEDRKNLEVLKERETTQTRMDKNSQVVIGRHPELEDAASEKTQIFQSILNQNPEWRTSPDGPLLVMYQMENELRKRGFDVDGSVGKEVDKERERVLRLTTGSLPTTRKTNGSNKIILTREQKEFCDQNGVSYEDYARTLQKAGGKTGVEI